MVRRGEGRRRVVRRVVRRCEGGGEPSPAWLIKMCVVSFCGPFLGCSRRTGFPDRTKFTRHIVGLLVT